MANQTSTSSRKALSIFSIAMINVVGGYMVTDRMLAMFKGKREGQK